MGGHDGPKYPLKSAVLERHGDAIRFHPTLLAFASHHRFEPRPVAIARGNEKGRVERAIRYVRDAFFAARRFADLDDLNAQAAAWCAGAAGDRPCPEDTALSVTEAFMQERALLLELPADRFAAHERLDVRIGKTPYARFDRNDYSVPHTHVRRTLTVLANTERVRIVDGLHVLAVHARSFDAGAQIEDAAHVQALVDQKHRARQHRATDALVGAVPPIRTLLVQAAALGHNLGSITAALVLLRQRCTIAELHEAVLDALARGVPHSNAVRLALERRRDEQGRPPANVVTLPEHLQRRDGIVTPHALRTYDTLTDHRTVDHLHDDPADEHPDATAAS